MAESHKRGKSLFAVTESRYIKKFKFKKNKNEFDIPNLKYAGLTL